MSKITVKINPSTAEHLIAHSEQVRELGYALTGTRSAKDAALVTLRLAYGDDAEAIEALALYLWEKFHWESEASFRKLLEKSLSR